MTPPLNSTPRHTSKKLKTSVSTKMCIRKCTEALFIIAKIKKQPKYSSDKQKNKMWYIQIMKYYLVTKRNKVLTCCNMDDP